MEITDDEDSVHEHTTWTGFILVGDNVDKNVHRSFQRVDYNTYAALDRIDLCTFSDTIPTTVVDPVSILPTLQDFDTMEHEFQILVSRFVQWCSDNVL